MSLTEFFLIGLPILVGFVASSLFLMWCNHSNRVSLLFGFFGWLIYNFGCLIGGIISRALYKDVFAAIGDNPGQIEDIVVAIAVGFGLYPFTVYLFKKLKSPKKLAGMPFGIAAGITLGYSALVLAVFFGPSRSRDNSIQVLALMQLKHLIRAQDEYFQRHGQYLSFRTDGDDVDQRAQSNLGICGSKCGPCIYSVAAEGKKFTATVKCPLLNGEYSTMGYVRTEPGGHEGLDGIWGECRKEGIYTAQRPLVNTIGPCNKQNSSIISVVSGSLKRLAVNTLPPDAEIRIDGKLIGKTTDRDRFISSIYGSFFWENPHQNKMKVTISKPGYETVTFPLDWGSYTYDVFVILRLLK